MGSTSLSLLIAIMTAMLGSVLLESSPLLAQVGNGISQPAPDDELVGVVTVEGTATDPDFLRYELAFFQEFNPLAGWIVFAQGDVQVIDGTLAIWDTTVGRDTSPVFPDGIYQLRLRVVRTDYNYDEYFVTGLRIANDTATPSPTPTITPTTTLIASTPGVGTPPATPFGAGPLPSLTPFPTPSPQVTLANSPLGPADESTVGVLPEREGLIDQLTSIDSSRFASAFWQGVIWVSYAFAALALYLLLRGIIRRLWRLIMTKLLR